MPGSCSGLANPWLKRGSALWLIGGLAGSGDSSSVTESGRESLSATEGPGGVLKLPDLESSDGGAPLNNVVVRSSSFGSPNGQPLISSRRAFASGNWIRAGVDWLESPFEEGETDRSASRPSSLSGPI
jgi:hypothetical protein